MRMLFLTLFYSGKSPIAPGTMGSILALILGIPILYYSNETIFLLGIFIGLISIKQIDIYENNGGIHDDKSIVIDELVGMWLTMGMAGISITGIIGSFLFFRLYDITKPSIIGKIDRNVKGGLGVVGDDALAGILAGLSVLLILKLMAYFQLDPNFGINVLF
ncbi:phosphatidylglycerophosphatase A [Helicobacter cappadocius]|uniref:Phosphatidylglycerophosphatase A n=1 Tax=Helicobacter cappadocius TaxID=3063998 RepID=A0AA90PK14_9HELI|nr:MULTISPECIES: phosphatidylglycerophosphatase A [unclassified Helicobacter]MDO7253758.1 phosphatidylglycerophosphatase A [Helicobacter sp. faydin-H75]MDP2539687.1 phosphatidylglycerophosphatase A [Helicobacter sp. faydin-H76]